MRGVVLIALLLVAGFMLWSVTQGDSATVPDQDLPDVNIPDDADEQVAEGTEKVLLGIPPWGWAVVALIIVVAVINNIRKKMPALFWLGIGLLVAFVLIAGSQSR